MSALAAVIVLGFGVGFAMAAYRLSVRADAAHEADVTAWNAIRAEATLRARGWTVADLDRLVEFVTEAGRVLGRAFADVWREVEPLVAAFARLAQDADLIPPPTRLGRLRWRARHAWWRLRERFSRAVDDALDGGSATW